MARMCPSAWIRSASAVVRNSLAMFGYPSCSACLAKARYRWLAWLSPAKAVLRFSSVVVTAFSLSIIPGLRLRALEKSITNILYHAGRAQFRRTLPLPIESFLLMLYDGDGEPYESNH